MSPALSSEEAILMEFLAISTRCRTGSQSTAGLQNWKCGGRRLVQIGSRLATANQLHQSFVKILSKHLAANKKFSFAFQQKSSAVPIMNPSPTDIVEHFAFVEGTLVPYATVAGHFPGVAAAAKAKPKMANKVEVPQEEPPKEDTQAYAVAPRTKSKGPNRSTPPPSPAKDSLKTPEPKREGYIPAP